MDERIIDLKMKGKIPLYEQIYLSFKKDIQTGKISFGEKLPSTRRLSKSLGVSRSTVELAYEQLLSEGYIESKPYKGYYAAQMEELYHLEPLRAAAVKKVEQEREYRYDFTPNGLDLKSFPYNAWRKLSKEILLDDRVELFRAGDSKGEYGFRRAICGYLYQARGVNCVPEQVVIGAGSDYLLMLLCMILGREHIIAVENPTYKQAYRLFLSQSYKVMPIAMDRSGMEVGILQKTAADVAYVTPSHQYPTGIVMPIGRRMELLKWADESQRRYVIEDDYDSEFRYKGKPIPALQGYDAHGRVIYLGTFSKSIAPAIRLSYMVLPEPLLDVYEEKCSFLNSTVSKVDQLIVQRFIEDGYYERHLNKTRALYKNRHDQLISSLKPLLGHCEISGEYAGVHLLLTFKNDRTEEELIELAKKEDIRVYGLSDYIVGNLPGQKPTVLLGYANLSEEKIREAGRILCKIWG